jgi:hypothetical protein
MFKVGVMLAVAASAVAATAGVARASSTGWCGYAEGTCDTSMTYVECSDGTVWALDQSWSVDAFAATVCGSNYTILQPSASTAPSDESGGDQTSESDFSLSSSMAPDPSQYLTEVQCSNGQIWAVASDDDFVCPAA